jgi:hypothetical protein
MSLTEQKKAEKKELKKKKEDERKRQVEGARMEEEERARLEREKMKSRRVKEEDTQPEEAPLAVLGPAPRADPYGSWKLVEVRYCGSRTYIHCFKIFLVNTNFGWCNCIQQICDPSQSKQEWVYREWFIYLYNHKYTDIDQPINFAYITVIVMWVE